MFCFALVLYLSNKKTLIFHLVFFFFFFLSLGPTLPKAIYGFSMLEMHGDVYVIGGVEIPIPPLSGFNWSIYQLSCSSGTCSWSTLNQELWKGRRYPVAIPVQDSICS
jgi:hypothetical protein